MANEMIIPPSFKAGPAAVFGGAIFDEDLGAGIQVGFAVIGYRGKTWSIKHQGNEIPITGRDAGGDIVALPSIELVILKAPNHLSKVWYEQGWSEDASAPPDCMSSNGLVPDLGVPKKQNDVCLTCKWNQFGSRPAQPGQAQQFKGKACSDNKRLAVVPLGDLNNEQYGGPMLLRVPPASLNDVLAVANTLKAIGFPYYAAGIKVGFDMTVSYPRFVFKPMRALSQEEGEIVMRLRDLDLTNNIVHGTPAPMPDQTPQQTAPAAPQSQQPVNVAPTQQQPPPPQQAAKPVQAPTGFGGTPPTQAAQQNAPQPKTAPTSGFGGSGNGAAAPHSTGGSAEPESSGVAQFDQALDKKLEGLL